MKHKLCKLVEKLQEASDLLDEIQLPTEEKTILHGKLYTTAMISRGLQKKYSIDTSLQLYALLDTAKGIATDDFLNELFNGQINPKDFLCDPEPVEQAIKVIKGFIEVLEEQGILDWV